MVNLTRSMAAIALLSIASLAMAQAPELYPQPFPGTINSTFGPRVTETGDKKTYTPGFHGGLDFLQGAGTSIPAAADGYVEDIKTDIEASGIRLWLKTKDNDDLGYMHLFSYKDNVRKNRSGTFVLLKRQPYLDQYDNVHFCNTILNTDKEAGFALVPKACAFAGGQSLPLDLMDPKRYYKVTNKVGMGSLIAPVGDSSSVVIGPHLHLQRGRPGNLRHPLGIFSPIHNNSGKFCARLGDANTNPPFAYALNCGSTATVPPYDLTTRPYIDVRVDATNRLDLDGAAFEISGTPIQQYSVLFGPPVVNGKLMKDTKEMVSDVVRKPNCSDNQIPPSGDLLICANHWKGQPSRLERVFRLGVDPAAVPKGCNSVDVKLIRAHQGATEEFKLKFKNGEGKPKAVNDVASTKINTPITIAIKSNDTNAGNQPLKDGDATVNTFPLADPSKGEVDDNPDGTITFTPRTGVTGPVIITYQLITPCGDKSNFASVTVTVSESVDLDDFKFEFSDARRTAGPTCVHRLYSPWITSSIYADFDDCRQYVEPVIRCVGKGCLNNRFAVATTGYSTSYPGQVVLVPPWTGGPIPTVSLGGSCSRYSDEFVKNRYSETYSEQYGQGWYPVSTSNSPIYPSGSYNQFLSGFNFWYFRNITNLLFQPQYSMPDPFVGCSPTGYAWTINVKVYDRYMDVYRDFSFNLTLP